MRANQDYLLLKGSAAHDQLLLYGNTGKNFAGYEDHYDITFMSGHCGKGFIYRSFGSYFVHKQNLYSKVMFGERGVYSSHGPMSGLSKKQALKELLSFCCPQS